MCGTFGGTVAVASGEICLEDWWTIRDFFSINPFYKVILLKERFSKQGKFFIYFNNGRY